MNLHAVYTRTVQASQTSSVGRKHFLRAHSLLRSYWELMTKKKEPCLEDMATGKLPILQGVAPHQNHVVSTIGVGIVKDNNNHNIEDMTSGRR